MLIRKSAFAHSSLAIGFLSPLNRAEAAEKEGLEEEAKAAAAVTATVTTAAVITTTAG